MPWIEQITPRLNELWQGAWDRGTVEPARFLYDHELVFVTEGDCHVEMAGQRWTLGPGQFIVVPPETCHVSWTEAGTFRQCLHFDWSSPPKRSEHPVCCFYPQTPARKLVLRAPAFVPRGVMAGEFDLHGPIPALAKRAFECWRQGDVFDRAISRALFLEILMWLLRPHAPPSSQKGARASQLALEVKALLDRRGADTIGIQALLETLGFSYPHLCRVFHDQFGLSPGRYRNAQRLERAKSLLRNSRLSVSEIAYASGFDDPGYFSRKFRQQNGTSPKAFR